MHAKTLTVRTSLVEKQHKTRSETLQKKAAIAQGPAKRHAVLNEMSTKEKETKQILAVKEQADATENKVDQMLADRFAEQSKLRAYSRKNKEVLAVAAKREGLQALPRTLQGPFSDI